MSGAHARGRCAPGLVLHCRSRGLWWSGPLTVLAVCGAAWFAGWLASRPYFDGPPSRVPAVVLGGLAVAVLVAVGLHRTDEEVEGSTPRPRRETEVVVVLGLLAVACVVAALLIGSPRLERGGLELARDAVGLTGLALLGGAVAGSRLSWALPFAWASVSYLAVTRDYERGSEWAGPGWLMFPATWTITWLVAAALLLLGALAQHWAGHVPRPRHHPLR